MDANGLRFWLLAARNTWRLEQRVEYDEACGRLRLRGERTELPAPPPDNAAALPKLELVPLAFDGYGARAFVAGNQLTVASDLPTAFALGELPAGEVLSDLAMGYDGVLYAALADDVVLIDTRQRWPPTRVHHDGFAAWRLAPDVSGGAWVLDRTNRQVGRVLGLPLANRIYREYAPQVARPVAEDADSARLVLIERAEIPTGETLVGIACSPQGLPALLTWLDDPGAVATPDEADARLRLLDPRTETFTAPMVLRGTRYPYSFAWLSTVQITVLQTNTPVEAFVYDLSMAIQVMANAEGTLPTALMPHSDYYPLRDYNGEPLLKGVTLPPHYPVVIDGVAGQAPLYPLSYPSYPALGWATNQIALDSGDTQTVWHRLYLEALIPQHTGVKVWLATTLTANEPVPDKEWHEHRFGEIYAHGGDEVPVGAWLAAGSEVPGQAGLLNGQTEPGRAGLFTVLIQRCQRRVRSLRGRYLRVKIGLFGDTRTTPEIGGLRAYGSRFSYVQHYLPELYHEQIFAPTADEVAPATEADFFERFVNLFEGILTPLEDQVAYAYTLMDARTAPEEALEWLGSWIGLSFDAAYPTARRRELLAVAPRLFRVRGTLYGLKLALDVVTGGGVRGGEIIVLEDFKLRRTFATILGADLADENDPLLQGLVISGNSYVGDTLFLGDEAAERRKEFLALFRDDLPKSAREQSAVAALFDRLAHRVTVLVHQDVEPQDFKLIRRVVELETPAHVVTRVFPATYPFLVGMAALVGVDTYLRAEPPARPVMLNTSRLGERDYLIRPASLDPRLSGSYPEPLLLPAA